MRTTLSEFIGDRRRDVIRLALTAFIGGLAEALFLVIVSRAAFAITDDVGEIDIFGGRTVSLTGAILAGLLLVAIRCACWPSGWQPKPQL